nr:uncharacterized protein LOC113735978 [Coffea arabica]
MVTNTSEKTAEEVGEDVFNELINESFTIPIFENLSPNINTFIVHPWIRRMLISIAKRLSFFEFTPSGMPSNGHRRAFLLPGGSDSYSTMTEDTLMVFNVNDQYLGFKPDWLSKLNRVEVLQLGRWQNSVKHHIEVENKDLTVESKKKKKVEYEVSLNGLGRQTSLRYLSLRGVSRLTNLPRSVLNLISLEILDLRACHNLEKLPSDISALRNLTHLDLSECYLLESMPKGIEELSALQVLKGFVIGIVRRNPCRGSDLADSSVPQQWYQSSITSHRDDKKPGGSIEERRGRVRKCGQDFFQQNDGMEQAIRTMEFRQDATEKLLKGLDQKYEGMMNMMAQLMAKVSDRGKELEGSSSAKGKDRPNESRMDLQKETVSKRDNRIGGRLPKIDLPIFEGNNPREWIRKANKYFKIHEIEENMKAEIGEGSPEEAIEEFNKLVQTGTVADYLEKFEMLKALVMPSLPHLSDSYYKACFMSGLKEEIVNMVKMSKPETLAVAIEIAKLQEKNLKAIQKIQKPTTTNFSNHRPPNKMTPTPRWNQNHPKHTNQNQDQKTSNQNQFKRITPTEFNLRREKGLCYKCAEPYTLGHVCKQSHVHFLLAEEAETREEAREPEEEVYCDCINGELTDEHIEVSIHALAGGTSHRTMKLKGLVKGRLVTALIDSGSTHCFLDEQLAKDLKLGTQGPNLVVNVANGEKVNSKGLDKPLQWEMQGHQFQHAFNTLRLGGCDMILGVDWLAKHSPIEFNFRKLSMKIHQGRQEVVLQGEGDIIKLKGLNGGRLAKWLRKQSYGVVAQLVAVEEEGSAAQLPAEIRQILEQYRDVFEEPKGMPPTRGHEHQINLKEGAKPFQVRPYRCPYIQKTEIEKLVREMLELGIIQPSSSPFASPVLLVKKKDGTWRFCVDYRQLNELTVKNKFPMPLIEELMDELHGAKFFTKIDLRAGYFQIRVKEEDISKTAFRTHQGLYEFKVMPFGLTNAPATFQSLMNQVFQDQMRRHVLVFFDDILVYSSTLEEHVKHVEEVMCILRQHQLYAKMSKCSFAQMQVEYLGHIITAEGVQADPKKIECMEQWPNPTNIKQLRGFLGLTGYYRRFVRGYGAIARPLTNLLKKDNFHWNKDSELAFQTLKKAMCTTPVLAVPDFTQPFIVETDACYSGIGAVLMQNRRPISYLSQALGQKNMGLSIYEKELLALVTAVTKWRHYLEGHHFIIHTDNQSLKYLLDQRITTPLQQKWLTKLLGLSYEIHYKKGKDNLAADALSRQGREEVRV